MQGPLPTRIRITSVEGVVEPRRRGQLFQLGVVPRTRSTPSTVFLWNLYQYGHGENHRGVWKSSLEVYRRLFPALMFEGDAKQAVRCGLSLGSSIVPYHLFLWISWRAQGRLSDNFRGECCIAEEGEVIVPIGSGPPNYDTTVYRFWSKTRIDIAIVKTSE